MLHMLLCLRSGPLKVSILTFDGVRVYHLDLLISLLFEVCDSFLSIAQMLCELRCWCGDSINLSISGRVFEWGLSIVPLLCERVSCSLRCGCTLGVILEVFLCLCRDLKLCVSNVCLIRNVS